MSQDDIQTIVWAMALAGLTAWGATGLVLRLLRSLEVLDNPNVRSSHKVATPRGGGLALVPIILVTWYLLARHWPDAAPAAFPLLLVAATALAVVSWIDDLRNLPAALRFVVQVIAVVAALSFSMPEGLVFQGFLPPLADRAISALAWLWFINLFNFMDGIDGISGVETASLGLGMAAVTTLLGGPALPAALALVLAAVALGFLVWNWAPAKLFLGDVGSVPIGFLLGWLLLSTAATGQWAVALILPLYYFFDASITLARRLRRREKVWQAHREHFYQRAVQNGFSHANVALRIGIANAGLILLAIVAAKGYPWPALLGASALVALLLYDLTRREKSV